MIWFSFERHDNQPQAGRMRFTKIELEIFMRDFNFDIHLTLVPWHTHTHTHPIKMCPQINEIPEDLMKFDTPAIHSTIHSWHISSGWEMWMRWHKG